MERDNSYGESKMRPLEAIASSQDRSQAYHLSEIGSAICKRLLTPCMGLWGLSIWRGWKPLLAGWWLFAAVETVFTELVQVYSVLCRVPWLIMQHHQHIPCKSLRYPRNVGHLFAEGVEYYLIWI